VDLAVGHGGDGRERFNFRIMVLGELGDRFDVQTFRDLPLYVRVEALKGKAVYGYGKISDEIAFESITKGRDDFCRFAGEIKGVLARYGER